MQKDKKGSPKFEKMWEASNVYVFDIDTGSVLPILHSLPRVSSFSDEYWMFYFQDGMGAAYYESGEMEKAHEVGRRIFRDDLFVERYFQGIEKVLQQQTDFFEHIAGIDLEVLDDKEIHKLLKQGVDLIVENFGYSLTSQPQYIEGLQADIQKRLSESVPQDELTDVFASLTTSTRVTTVKQEEIDWLNILIKAKATDGEIENKIDAHYQTYRLLNAADSQDPFTREYYLNKFEEESDRRVSELEEMLSDVTRSATQTEREKAALVKQYSIDPETVRLCNLIAEIGYYRFEMRVRGWMPGYYYNQLILRHVAKRHSYDDTEIRFATVQEVSAVLDGIAIDKELLTRRADTFAFVIERGVPTVYAGSEAVEKFNALAQKEDVTDVREIKGSVAMTGKVTGTALVYKWTDNIEEKMSKMDENTILVTGQTRPQIMPLISKSKAIVTDEGGITSHAAIVSRELKIPCVIGTKIATQVLTDGDLVEVDANTGIVRILKKSKPNT